MVQIPQEYANEFLGRIQREADRLQTENIALRAALAEFVRDGYCDPTDRAVIRARALLGLVSLRS